VPALFVRDDAARFFEMRFAAVLSDSLHKIYAVYVRAGQKKAPVNRPGLADWPKMTEPFSC
jgi:hypothetical protein